jgi:hypothetical protein
MPEAQTIDRHYSPQEIAGILSVSPDTVRDIFKEMAGVVKIERPRVNKRARPYVTLRIPETVFQQWYGRASAGFSERKVGRR